LGYFLADFMGKILSYIMAAFAEKHIIEIGEIVAAHLYRLGRNNGAGLDVKQQLRQFETAWHYLNTSRPKIWAKHPRKN